MATRDLHNSIEVVKLMTIAEVTADTWSSYVDLNGFESAEFIVENSALTGGDADNYITPVLYEASDTPASSSSYSAVDSGDILGAFVAVADESTTTTQAVGYIGGERYVAVKLDETLTISAGYWSVTAILSHAGLNPPSAPTTGTVT